MATRSGARFKPAEPVQTSIWCCRILDLAEVMSQYLSLEHKLEARTVCKAWRSAWGSQVPALMLDQPMSVAAARSLGRKAAAAFPDVSKARIKLYHSGLGAHISFRGGTMTELPALGAERPAAAKACVRQLQALCSLRRVHFCTDRFASVNCSTLQHIIPQLSSQQLRVLDLTELLPPTSVLPVIAAHLTQLQELVLGAVRPWVDSEMAALAAVSTLRKLTCESRPASGITSGVGALTQLTELLLKLCPPRVDAPSKQQADEQRVQLIEPCLRQLSNLTALRSLSIQRLALGGEHHRLDKVEGTYSFSDAWAVALGGMRQLKRLELRGVDLSDGLLCAAGAVPVEYLFVHMGQYSSMPLVTAVGAAAAESLGAVELQVHKFFNSCCPEFTRLPCVKRFVSEYGRGSWCTADSTTCPCPTCWPRGTHCKRDRGDASSSCCGHCKGKECACDVAVQLATAGASCWF